MQTNLIRLNSEVFLDMCWCVWLVELSSEIALTSSVLWIPIMKRFLLIRFDLNTRMFVGEDQGEKQWYVQRKKYLSWRLSKVCKSVLYFVSTREWLWRHWWVRCKHAAFTRQSGGSFWMREKTHMLRAIISHFLCKTRWRHGRSRGETKYNLWCTGWIKNVIHS